MSHAQVSIDATRIKDWGTYQTVMADTFGFPEEEGHNMDAWVEFLLSLDAPINGNTKVHAPPGGLMIVELQHANDLAKRCPVIYATLMECLGFVNHRRTELGREPVLCVTCPP
jgi:hypothetical protein